MNYSVGEVESEKKSIVFEDIFCLGDVCLSKAKDEKSVVAIY